VSEEEFEVRGPHEEVLESSESEWNTFSSKIAVATAILATMAAFFSYQAGSSQNAAAMFKNDAAIKRIEAADQWSLFEAKSGKQNLAEIALLLNNADHEKYIKNIARYNNEKMQIKKIASDLENKSRDFDAKSEAVMHVHHRWALAMTLMQISISMAAITLLTRKKTLSLGVIAMAGGGLVFALFAIIHI
jgi:Domain of unknown function (DUF4337)